MLVKKSDLQAVILAAGVKDVRYYLNGVHVNAKHLVATDGSRMHVVAHGGTWEGPPVTVPREAILLALKEKVAVLELTPTSVGRVSYSPLDGTFPDYTRVMVRAPAKGAEGVIRANLIPSNLADAVKAISLADDEKNPTFTFVGREWLWTSKKIQVVLMPTRNDKDGLFEAP